MPSTTASAGSDPSKTMRLLRIHVHHRRLKGTGLGILHGRVGNEDDKVAHVDQVGGGPVDPDDPEPRSPAIV